jgi:arylsulfatase A-like enzyme
MLPTFAEAIGYQQPLHTDGLSFLPTLLGRKGQQEHPYLYWEFHEKQGKQAVRWGNWKGIRLNVSAEQPVFELYDLSKDIHEDNNVAAQHPDIVRRLEALIDSCHIHSDVFNFGRK